MKNRPIIQNTRLMTTIWDKMLAEDEVNYSRIFKKKIKRLFKESNPTATIVEWVKPPRRVTYPTGIKGIYGAFKAEATGYKTKIMIADYDEVSGFSVR